MLQYDFEQSIGYWVISTARILERELNDELAPSGITYRQCQILGCLALDGQLSQSELAERMRIEPPTLVALLDRMEQEGWISRCCCPEDRRKKVVRPCPAAEPVWAKIVAAARRVRARATRGMSPSEVETLKRLLRKVQENLQQTAAARAS